MAKLNIFKNLEVKSSNSNLVSFSELDENTSVSKQSSLLVQIAQALGINDPIMYVSKGWANPSDEVLAEITEKLKGL